VTTTERRALAWVVGGAAVLVAIDLGRRILANNDEARFPLLAQDILQRGDWLFPTLNGTVYHNKPLLLAWLIALASWPVGYVTQFTAVIPSATAAVATALVVFGLGREMFGADAGKYAALMTLTTQGVFLHSRLPMPDMLMTAFITASLWALWRMTRDAPRAWLGFYPLVGLAFWAKGPGGFLPLGVALVWALVSRRPGRWRALHLPLGLPLLAVVVAPWPLLRLVRHADGLRQAVVQNQLFWYLPFDARPAMVAEPIQNAFGILFPWVFVLPLALVEAVRRLRGRDGQRDAVLFLLVASATMFIGIALSNQQRFRYYLPLVGPVALLTGWWAANVIVRGRVALRVPWRVYGAVGVVVVVAAVAGAFFRRNALNELALSWPGYAAQAVVLILTVGAVAAALIVGAPARRLSRAFAAAWVGCAILVAWGYHWELERRNAAHDYSGLRERMKPHLRESPVVATLGLADMPLAFYLGRPVVPAASDVGLRAVVRGAAPAVAIVTDRALPSLANGDEFTILMRDRLALRPIAVVAYRAAPPDRRQ
jgi:4-amino-4-deoxy-L-arabinose transferase-like glycosyltransferase